MPSLLIPIVLQLVEIMASTVAHPRVWWSGFQLVSNFVQPRSTVISGGCGCVCLVLFYFNGEFDPGSG